MKSRKGTTDLHDHRNIVVWRFVDGKPGHDNQTLGLVRALARHRDLDPHTLSVAVRHHYIFSWIMGRFPADRGLPDPDLLIGAGHATHYPMLRARRRRGGRIVTLMRPSLPSCWFDLCVLPEHDLRPATPANTLITSGVLNTIQPSDHLLESRGLILIGGPSQHFEWLPQRVFEAIERILDDNPRIHWTLTTSRRTPPGFADQIAALGDRITIVPHQQTDREWVPQQLSTAGTVWVTADSVSMVYEALTAGGRVGVLPLPSPPNDRVAQGIQRLIEARRVTLPESPASRVTDTPFNEADRCAQWILEQWFTP